MASSDDKEETLFSKRPEWADITPIPQDEGPTPLVPIAYAPDYADAMNCFRAILRSEERSPRVLELTKFLVRQNPAHYTVWKYRLDTVLALSSSIPPELTFIDEMASETPKSYQIWHYRQALISHLNDASAEHAFINEQLAVDSKNYHCWSYRQWAVSRFALWEKELPDVEKLVDEDVRNNSAWNQRYWVMRNRPEGFEEGNLEEEIGYVVGKIRLSPRNESPWAYLRGIIKLAGKQLTDFPDLETLCNEYADHGPHASAFLLDIAEARKDTVACKDICARLENTDPVRRKYWKHRADLVS